MSTTVYFQGCSALNQSGLYSMRTGHQPWHEGQNGPRDVERKQVFDTPFTGFGKLQIADKLAFCAAALLFGDIAIDDKSNIGISMGTAFGSLSTDLRYMESVASGFPRPAYFSATLPSSPVAEVAIQFRLKGPNRVIAGGECPGLCALDNAVSILACGKAPAMLVLLVSALEQQDADSVLVAGRPDKLTYSYACLLSREKLEGGLNYTATFNPVFRNFNDAAESEESYFVAMTQAAIEKTGCRCDMSVRGFRGSLSIEKES